LLIDDKLVSTQMYFSCNSFGFLKKLFSSKNLFLLEKNSFLKTFHSSVMGFLSNFRKDLETAKREKAAQINGKNLKGLLKKFKQERDRIEKETGVRPQIDETTLLFMRKVLNEWIKEGKEIDEEKFWREVDYNRQFTHSVEYYEIKR